MFVAHVSLNNSFPEGVLYSYCSSNWFWLVIHVLYTVYVSTVINVAIYFVSLVINSEELFLNLSMREDQRFLGLERAVDIEHGYRHLKAFVVQLIALAFGYVLGAYYYKSVIRSTSVDWVSFIRWLIEASCDFLYFSSVSVSARLIPASATLLNNHFASLIETLLVIKLNQFVMMRYAEFHSHSCLNTIRVIFFYYFCGKAEDHSWDVILTSCFLPDESRPDFPK